MYQLNIVYLKIIQCYMRIIYLKKEKEKMDKGLE